MRDWTSLLASLGIALLATAVTGPALGSYVLFESGPVRPLALSPDGSRLFAVNTPDATLERRPQEASCS